MEKQGYVQNRTLYDTSPRQHKSYVDESFYDNTESEDEYEDDMGEDTEDEDTEDEDWEDQIYNIEGTTELEMAWKIASYNTARMRFIRDDKEDTIEDECTENQSGFHSSYMQRQGSQQQGFQQRKQLIQIKTQQEEEVELITTDLEQVLLGGMCDHQNILLDAGSSFNLIGRHLLPLLEQRLAVAGVELRPISTWKRFWLGGRTKALSTAKVIVPLCLGKTRVDAEVFIVNNKIPFLLGGQLLKQHETRISVSENSMTINNQSMLLRPLPTGQMAIPWTYKIHKVTSKIDITKKESANPAGYQELEGQPPEYQRLTCHPENQQKIRIFKPRNLSHEEWGEPIQEEQQLWEQQKQQLVTKVEDNKDPEDGDLEDKDQVLKSKKDGDDHLSRQLQKVLSSDSAVEFLVQNPALMVIMLEELQQMGYDISTLNKQEKPQLQPKYKELGYQHQASDIPGVQEEVEDSSPQGFSSQPSDKVIIKKLKSGDITSSKPKATLEVNDKTDEASKTNLSCSKIEEDSSQGLMSESEDARNNSQDVTATSGNPKTTTNNAANSKVSYSSSTTEETEKYEKQHQKEPQHPPVSTLSQERIEDRRHDRNNINMVGTWEPEWYPDKEDEVMSEVNKNILYGSTKPESDIMLNESYNTITTGIIENHKQRHIEPTYPSILSHLPAAAK
jgi:hypothetical protein